MADFNNGYRNLQLEEAVGWLQDLLDEANIFLVKAPHELEQFLSWALAEKQKIESMRSYGPIEISDRAKELAKFIESKFKTLRKEIDKRRAIQEYDEARELEGYKPGEVNE